MTNAVLEKSILFQKVKTETPNLEFSKTSLGRYLFAFGEYLYNRSPKLRAKNILQFLAIVT